MIRVNVFIQVSEDNRVEMLELCKELVAATVKENGCIAYDVFESATRRGVLIICETWTDAGALAAHEKTAHFTALIPKIQALGSLKIEKFDF